MVRIRVEQASDAKSIRELHHRAFAESPLGYHGEAELVDRLRSACSETVSLVAEIDGQLVGHMLLTPVVIEGDGRTVTGTGLAPMSVLPEFQRQGIGSRLVRDGMEIIHQAGCPFIVVLGHPEYYLRFGFERASLYGVACQFPNVPVGAFMIRVLDETISIPSGVANYRAEFTDE